MRNAIAAIVFASLFSPSRAAGPQPVALWPPA
jgi:hypothetical protein